MHDGASKGATRELTCIAGAAVQTTHTAFCRPLLESGSFGVLAYATGPEPDKMCTWGTFNSSQTVHYWLKHLTFATPAPRWRPVLFDRHSSQAQVADVITTLSAASSDKPLSIQELRHALSMKPGSDHGLISEVLTCLAGIGLLSYTVSGGSSHKQDLCIR